ncbi:hypothetical protein [Ponticoccus alexandrii]|uniref:Uncharacterized protein n=1 Tax=Ponticoccus alexandrii TaxID=1943633 RepID=A0ABX7F8D0_9RHOB|nr:hypothetical protein [Ponticoccus alexandrii]ETA51492.1 hypothetical protein P279_13785 [Rhodobacteraceae bacterium PD-2]QRF66527.1 hypothetical protein GQA70_09525 [Ponticoccus alexandrii]
MARNLFYRDFTLCKAAALVALIGLAAALGGVPHASDLADNEPDIEHEARVMPATLLTQLAACPEAAKVGVRL